MALANSMKALANNSPFFFVGIAGLGGSGKTTLCKQLAEILGGQAMHCACDVFSRYSLRERREKIDAAIANSDNDGVETEENPKNWYNWNSINEALHGLKNKKSYTYPHGWNSETGEIDREVILNLPDHDNPIVLVDCIYLLHLPVRNWFDLSILVDTPLETTIARARVRAKNSADSDYFEYRQNLVKKYDVPYFAGNASRTDWIFRL